MMWDIIIEITLIYSNIIIVCLVLLFYVTRCYNVRLMHNQLKVDYNIVTETITLLTIKLGLPSAHLSPQINKQQHHSMCCNWMFAHKW